MAANDYYNTTYSASGALPPPHSPTHSDPPLPPVPGTNNHSQQGVSPITSPFDDSNRYDYPSTTHLAHTNTTNSSAYTDTAYHGSETPHNYNSRYDPPANHQSDPFGDHSAIPLQNQGKMGEGAASAAVYGADPERRYTGEKRRKKKKGWFSGRITWVVYTLTAVQIGVFVGEIIKNGMSSIYPVKHIMI
jgi:hypothetical protein